MHSLIGLMTLGISVAAWSNAACAQLVDTNGLDLMKAQDVFTLTNLHPDEVRMRLYAVNYQQPGLIPRCTPVRLTRLRKNELRFVVIDRGREYEYLNHDAAAEPFNQHLLRFFGTKCDVAEVEQLRDVDQRGIREGRVLPGMSRRGVILAIGYPPRHVNPSIEFGNWMYWANRFDRFEVVFGDDGLVTGVRN